MAVWQQRDCRRPDSRVFIVMNHNNTDSLSKYFFSPFFVGVFTSPWMAAGAWGIYYDWFCSYFGSWLLNCSSCYAFTLTEKNTERIHLMSAMKWKHHHQCFSIVHRDSPLTSVHLNTTKSSSTWVCWGEGGAFKPYSQSATFTDKEAGFTKDSELLQHWAKR